MIWPIRAETHCCFMRAVNRFESLSEKKKASWEERLCVFDRRRVLRISHNTILQDYPLIMACRRKRPRLYCSASLIPFIHIRRRFLFPVSTRILHAAQGTSKSRESEDDPGRNRTKLPREQRRKSCSSVRTFLALLESASAQMGKRMIVNSGFWDECESPALWLF